MLYSLTIKAGTKVLSEKSNSLVELKADAYVPEAIRQEDGGFIYSVGKNRYYCSSGCCQFEPEQYQYGMIHKTGLVAFV